MGRLKRMAPVIDVVPTPATPEWIMLPRRSIWSTHALTVVDSDLLSTLSLSSNSCQDYQAPLLKADTLSKWAHMESQHMVVITINQNQLHLSLHQSHHLSQHTVVTMKSQNHHIKNQHRLHTNQNQQNTNQNHQSPLSTNLNQLSTSHHHQSQLNTNLNHQSLLNTSQNQHQHLTNLLQNQLSTNQNHQSLLNTSQLQLSQATNQANHQ